MKGKYVKKCNYEYIVQLQLFLTVRCVYFRINILCYKFSSRAMRQAQVNLLILHLENVPTPVEYIFKFLCWYSEISTIIHHPVPVIKGVSCLSSELSCLDKTAQLSNLHSNVLLSRLISPLHDGTFRKSNFLKLLLPLSEVSL